MKKFVLIFSIVILICSICYASTENVSALLNGNIKVSYDNKIQQFKNVNGLLIYPITYNGTTYLPVRAVSSLFNKKIEWDEASNSIYLGKGFVSFSSAQETKVYTTKQNEYIEAILNKDIKIYYNDSLQIFRDVSGNVIYPLSYEGTTYLPVRALSNLFGKDIQWDGNSNTVFINEKISTTPTVKPKESAEAKTINVTGIFLDKKSIVLSVGQSETLIAEITPSNATNKSISWSVSNNDVITVTNGKVIAKKEGSAVVSCKTADGNKIASCTVLVKEAISDIPVSTISLNKTLCTLTTGKSETLTATVTPSNATDKSIKWSSSNTDVITVTHGIVIARKAGSAVVIARASNGKIAVCTFKVEDEIKTTQTPQPTKTAQPIKTLEPTKVLPTSIRLNLTNITLKVGEYGMLVPTLTPSNADSTILWSSSNANIASVSNGLVTAKKAGSVVIIAKTSNDKMAICNVKVENKTQPTATPTATQSSILPTDIKLDYTNVKLKVGETKTLKASLVPSNANASIAWVSKNTDIATVSKGTIKARKVGSTIISVMTTNGKIANCNVTVEANSTVEPTKTPVPTSQPTKTPEPTIKPTNTPITSAVPTNTPTPTPVTPTKITLDKKNVTLKVGKTITLKATLSPSNATGTIKWSSTNTNVATVNQSGKVTAIKSGTARILAVINGLISSCTVNVEPVYGNLEIHFIDTVVKTSPVDATYIKIGDKSIFIDGGFKSTGRKAIEYLDKLGVKKIDYYIASHSHRDHVEAAPEIISKYNVDIVMVGREKSKDSGSDTASWAAIKAFASEQKLLDRVTKCKVKIFQLGETIEINGLKITCIGPISINTSISRGDTGQNYNSAILKFEYGKTSFIMAGDNSSASKFNEAKNKYPNSFKADVYKNSHHYGDNQGIYSLIKPKYVVFPTNTEKQPSSSCLSKVKNAGANYFITSSNKDGTVVFRSDGENLTVKTKQ